MYPKLFALFLATFSVGTTEFVISGILPAIATDLHTSIPTAGLLVTGYAAGVAIGGPLLTLVTARLPRKPALIGVLSLFVAAHIIGALAPDYTVLMIARVLAAACHGCFNGLAIVMAASLATEDKRGSAIAVVLAAVPVANILGVPLGTLLGNAFGWRTTFWLVAILAVIGILAISWVIENVESAGAKARFAQQLRALGNQRVLTSYSIIILIMVGFWTLNTFVAPYLTDIADVPLVLVAGVLLLSGVGGTIGTFLGGRFANRRPTETIVVGLPALGLVYGGFLLLAPHNPFVGLRCLASSGWLA